MKYLLSIILIFILFPLSKTSVYAQELSSGIATYVSIPNTQVHDGDIISFSNKGYGLSTAAYDPKAFGIMTKHPSLSLEETEPLPKNSYPVVSTGKVMINVSSINGPIIPGDLITTSAMKGVGQKATDDGYVIGTALDAYSSQDTSKTGQIMVSLNFGFYSPPATLRTNLLSKLNAPLTLPFFTPNNAFRYIFSAISVVLSILLGISFFGRSSRSGVEALGRNPLASKAIIFGIILNLFLSITILGVGIAIAYLILIL